MTMAGIFFVLLFVLCGALADYVDICGLNCVNKCWLSDPVCIKELDYAVRAWSNTSESEGFFLDSLDPLAITQLSIDMGTKRVILSDVLISGLVDSNYQVRVSLHDSQLVYHEEYTHEAVLQATRSSVLFLKTGVTMVDATPVQLVLGNLKTSTSHQGSVVVRCGRSAHLYTEYEPIDLSGGSMHILSGLNTVFAAVDKADYTIALIDKVSELCTLAIINNLRMVNSIADFNTLYLDNISHII